MRQIVTPVPKTTLNVRGRLLDLSRPVVMGIINVTPDSFYAGSRAGRIEQAVAMAGKMLEEGAALLDVGGFSTRPGAAEVNRQEETGRVVPVVEALSRYFPQAVISVDTFRATVAQAALDAGAAMVNDITAGSDPEMFGLLSRYRAPYIMMHMRLPVTDMMADTRYDDLLGDMLHYFAARLQQLAEMDITEVVIDPGFGFSKTLEQNYEILKNLTYFEVLGVPILAGISRKSMIYKLLDTTPEGALAGTCVAHFAALQNGARILRVHDVKEAVQTVKIYNQLKR